MSATNDEENDTLMELYTIPKDEYCELLDENDKLRERLEAVHLSRLLDENEIESLYELVQDMYACISHANEMDWFYFERDKPGCGMSCVVNGEGCGLSVFADRMRELGVEVDE